MLHPPPLSPPFVLSVGGKMSPKEIYIFFLLCLCDFQPPLEPLSARQPVPLTCPCSCRATSQLKQRPLKWT